MKPSAEDTGPWYKNNWPPKLLQTKVGFLFKIPGIAETLVADGIAAAAAAAGAQTALVQRSILNTRTRNRMQSVTSCAIRGGSDILALV